MRNIYFSVLGLIFMLPVLSTVSAQRNISDSTIFTTLMYASYSYQIPAGDLALQFGGNSSIGGGIAFKTRGNWIIGAEGNFMFGQTVKNSENILKGITTPEGYLIDANGFVADIVWYERGFNFLGKIGKVIPVLAPNPNSGFTLIAGAGYIQDKIRIHNPGNTAPQILGDYKKGYDRLNGGLAVTGSIGYMYLGNKRLLNFGAGFDFMQAWTTPYRERNFDTGLKDERKLSSQFYSFRISWIIPLYGRAPEKFYVY
jgi:hypothetical protein